MSPLCINEDCEKNATIYLVTDCDSYDGYYLERKACETHANRIVRRYTKDDVCCYVVKHRRISPNNCHN